MIFDKKNVIKIDSDDIKDASLSSADFESETDKKRAFVDVLGARLGMKMMFSQKLEANNLYSMYTIHNFLGDLDISDIYYQGVKLDVRVVFNKDEIFVPKKHFEYGILPDAYLVLLVEQGLGSAEFIGFFEPQDLNKKNSNKDYYFFEIEKLQRPDDLSEFLQNFIVEHKSNISDADVEKTQSLYLPLVDKEIAEPDKKFLLQCLSKSIALREELVEFENFELLSGKVAQDELLLQDGVLDIVGTQKIFNELDDNDLTKNEIMDEILNEGVNVIPVAVGDINPRFAAEMDIDFSGPIGEFQVDNFEEVEEIQENFAQEQEQEDILEALSDLDEMSESEDNIEFESDNQTIDLDDFVSDFEEESHEQEPEYLKEIADSIEVEEEIEDELFDLDSLVSETEQAVEEELLTSENEEELVDIETISEQESIYTEPSFAEDVVELEELAPIEAFGEIEELSSFEPEEEMIEAADQMLDFSQIVDESESFIPSEESSLEIYKEDDNEEEEDVLLELEDTILGDYQSEVDANEELSSEDIEGFNDTEDADLIEKLRKVDDDVFDKDSVDELDEDTQSITSQVDELLNHIEDIDLSDEDMSVLEHELEDIPDDIEIEMPQEAESIEEELQRDTNADAGLGSEFGQEAQVSQEPIFEEQKIDLDFLSGEEPKEELNKDLLKSFFNKENLDVEQAQSYIGDKLVNIKNLDVSELIQKINNNKKLLVAVSVTSVVVASLIIGTVAVNLKHHNNAISAENQQIATEAIPQQTPDEMAQSQDGEIMNGEQGIIVENLEQVQPNLVDKSALSERDMSKAVSDAFLSEPVNASVSKIAWEVPEDLAYNESFRKYLQMAGKNLKLTLQNDLLTATEMAYSNKVVVDMEINKDGSIASSEVTVSSGSKQIDKIVLQSVKETLKYLKVPASELSGGNVPVTLIINF